MKNITRLFLFLLILTVSLIGDEYPHLILNVDINKTLIASDKAGGKLVEDVLNEMMAEKYVALWDHSQQKMTTFETYVEKVLLSESLNDQEFSKLRKYHLQHFIDFLSAHNHPLYETVLHEYETALSTLTAVKGKVFPSFFTLLNHLEQKGISYSVILRSYGKEISEVKNEIEAVQKIVFKHTGKFRKGNLILDHEKPITDHAGIYQQLRRISHTAIHDDWQYWSAGKMCTKLGKPFYVDRNDPETLSIFFDDNIGLKNSDTNIIASLDASNGELIPIEELIESGQAVPVNTLEAILNTDYFKKHVEDALYKHLRRYELIEEKVGI